MSEATRQGRADGDGEASTGWLVLAERRSMATLIDALLNYPPHREFNQTELAEIADISRQSVNSHLNLLVDVGVLEPVDGTSPRRFRFDPENRVSRAIIELDGAMNAAGPFA
jgi:hypothetical protein